MKSIIRKKNKERSYPNVIKSVSVPAAASKINKRSAFIKDPFAINMEVEGFTNRHGGTKGVKKIEPKETTKMAQIIFVQLKLKQMPPRDQVISEIEKTMQDLIDKIQKRGTK